MKPPTSTGEPPGHDGLTFAWSSRRQVVAHLGLFLAISAGVHFFGFYLFQVVYPVTARVEPVPSRVRLLDPALPEVSALMRQIDDRLVFLRPASAGSEARVRLADHAVPFRPSFADGDLGLRRVPLAAEGEGFGEDWAVILPPVGALEMAPATLRNWRIGGGLSNREPRRPENLTEVFEPFAKAAADRGAAVRLTLTADRLGNVRSVQFADEEDKANPALEKLALTVLSHLRFEPLAESAPETTPGGETLQRGWLDIGR